MRIELHILSVCIRALGMAAALATTALMWHGGPRECLCIEGYAGALVFLLGAHLIDQCAQAGGRVHTVSLRDQVGPEHLDVL